MSNYKEIEEKTRIFLETLQKQGGPPIYILSSVRARALLSNLQAAYPVEKIPADIESRTIP
jgi:acetyl esterase